MKTYRTLWDNVSALSISEVCDFLDIDIIRDAIRCPSPHHEDRNPSCKIKDDKFCHCFACGFSANPLKLVQTVKGISRWEALNFINHFTPVIAVDEQAVPEELRLTKWEMACLGLKTDPLLPYTVRITDQSENTKTLYNTLEVTDALEIINDKFIENCATQAMFLDKFSCHAKNIFYKAIRDDCNVGDNPVKKLWKYKSQEDFQKACKAYESKVNAYVLKQTGLKFDKIEEWILSGKEVLVDKAIFFAGKKHYAALVQKSNDIISILEREEEESLNDRESTSTMVR